MNALPNASAALLWRFGNAEFDEAAFVLRVGGVECEVQMRPLQVLQLTTSCIYAVVLLVAGLFYFKRVERRFADIA